MRITYRTRDVKEYWAARWSDIPADDPMGNRDAYPLKYAEMAVASTKTKILEAGCGAGRILRYYHEREYNIVGIDYIDVAIEKLRLVDSSLQVEVGDITNLRFEDSVAFKDRTAIVWRTGEVGGPLTEQSPRRLLIVVALVGSSSVNTE